MVNAGLVDITIVDDFMVEFWHQVFPNIQPQPATAVRSGAEIAIGVRKNNPKLLQAAKSGSRSTVRAPRSATRWSAATCRTPTT
jgi:hypothetical protein